VGLRVLLPFAVPEGRHEAAGIHRTYRRRSCDMASRWAGATVGQDTTDRRAVRIARGRSDSTVPPRCILGGAPKARTGGTRDGHALCGIQRRGDASAIREGTRRVAARPTSFANHGHYEG